MEKSDLYKLKKEINLLRSNLNSIITTKREKIREIQKIRTEIREILKKVNEFKEKKSSVTNDINELRKQRDVHNKNVKDLISNLKELNKEISELEKKFKIKINPLAIKEKITKLETKIETEIISFDKEKQLMAELRKLKADFKNSGTLFQAQEKAEKIAKEIREEREKANSFHNKIKEILNLNKDKEFKNLFKDLDKLRKDQEDKQNEVDEINKNSENLNEELNLKLTEIGKISPSVKEDTFREEKKKREAKILEEKSKIVEEKLKNKGKLTTEDLLVLQSKMKDE